MSSECSLDETEEGEPLRAVREQTIDTTVRAANSALGAVSTPTRTQTCSSCESPQCRRYEILKQAVAICI
ncbi:unnamed protein product [Trichogramma brassicae]|uniref:Uncharacterized protein n=1 Tax=Trichogramma brassicae TaxID=86971 RepID=A0A6H5HT12_9HYME|nr:unnamed protein product [Trichogramma brassicae]